MPLFKTIKISGGLIGVWQLTESATDLTPNFSSEELSNPEFQKYTYEKRQVEWLATRLLLQQLIGSEFAISYSDSGKPILNHNQYKHISISHSRYFVTIFVHEQLNVGIDIEDMTRNYKQIEKRFLSENELGAVDKNPILQCLYWCAKEAVFKLVPDEGVEFREQIRISSFNPKMVDQFTACYSSGSSECIYQLYFQIFCDHGLVWVMENDQKLKDFHISE